jgi:hypothetical protein
MDTRADGYASTRTAGELTQVRDDLAMARAQAKRGSLTDRLAAAYGHALAAETDRRDCEPGHRQDTEVGFGWLS